MRIEKWLIGICLAVMFLVAVPAVELFPFSNSPMFAAVYEEFWVYRLKDAHGQRLNLDVYGLRSNPNWYLEPHYAVRFPQNHVNPPSQLPEPEQLLRQLQSVGREKHASFPLHLEARAIGDVGDQRIGIITTRVWRIESPP